MNKLILCLLIIVLPIAAEEIGLGCVWGAEGDSLILADGLKVYVPNLSSGSRYLNAKNEVITSSLVRFPFMAALVTMESVSLDEDDFTKEISRVASNVYYVKILRYYEVVNGRMVDRGSSK